MNNVSIATTPVVYSAFRHLTNTSWNALAEFVDNSIASWNIHKAELKPINKDGKLHINITINDEKIVIEDDAFGIEDDRYESAFELANLPLDTSGLNEFGMGMKIAGIWLSNKWTVETSPYKQPYQRDFVFDLHKVVDNQMLILPIVEKEANSDIHFTRVILENLTENAPRGGQGRNGISVLKEKFSVIYSRYINSGEVELTVNGTLLAYEKLVPLKYRYVKGDDPVEYEWCFPFDFSYEFSGKKYSAKGFIGILQKMKTNQNGFLLFRRGRVIASREQTHYYHQKLCGQIGSPQEKRIFGEIELEGFSVSFTKNSIQDAEFELFMRYLAQHIAGNKNIYHNIFKQAEYYREPVDVTKIQSTITKIIQDDAKKVIELPSVPSALDKKIQTIQKFSQDVTSNQVIPSKPVTLKVKINDKEHTIHLSFVNGKPQDCFLKIDIISVLEISTTVNYGNSYFNGKSDLLEKKEVINLLTYFVKTYSYTYLQMIHDGEIKTAEDFTDCFNIMFSKI